MKYIVRPPYGPDNSRQLIRHRDRRLVPTSTRGGGHRPLVEACALIGRSTQSGPQDGARAMGQERSQVDISPLADPT
jgi:hypothetical protein